MAAAKESKNDERVSPYSDEELEYFKEIIIKKRDEAEQELTTLQNLLRESMENASDESAYSFHMADAGTDAQEREKTYMLFNRTKKFIRYLDYRCINLYKFRWCAPRARIALRASGMTVFT